MASSASSWQTSSGSLPPDNNQGHWVLALIWPFRALAVIVVLLRLYTRSLAKKALGWDDACISISACLTIVGGINDSIRTAHGWGRHIEYLTQEQNSFIQRWMFIGEEVNFFSTFFVRFSICIFTMRLLPITQIWSRRFTYLAATFNFISTLTNLIVFGTRCVPTQGIWNWSLHAKCLSLHQIAIAFGCASALGVIADFVVIIVPVLAIRNLQMNRRTKVGISIIMCLSFATALCSIGKMCTTINIKDPIYDTVPVFCFSIFEETLGIICASMPAMRQLYKHIKSKRGQQRIPEDPNQSNSAYSIGSGPNEKKPSKSLDVELQAIDDLDSRP